MHQPGCFPWRCWWSRRQDKVFQLSTGTRQPFTTDPQSLATTAAHHRPPHVYGTEGQYGRYKPHCQLEGRSRSLRSRLRTARIQYGCGGDKKEGQEGGGTYNVCEDWAGVHRRGGWGGRHEGGHIWREADLGPSEIKLVGASGPSRCLGCEELWWSAELV